MRFIFGVLAVLVVVSLAVPAGATPTTTLANGSTDTPDQMSTDRVRSLLNQSEEWSTEQADAVFWWVRTQNLSEVSTDTLGKAYERLLARAPRSEVPDDVLRNVTGAISEDRARAIARDVADRLPEADAERLSAHLSGIGEGLGSALDGVLAAIPNPTPTVTPTSSSPTATPTPATTPTETAIAANTKRMDLGPAVTVTDWEFTDGEFRMTVEADQARTVTITDSGAMMNEISKSGGGSTAVTIPKRTFAVTPGTETLVFDVEQFRGEYAVSIATRGRAAYIGTGVMFGNPFSGGDPTLGWFGGAGLSVLMFVLAGWWTLRNESIDPKKATFGGR